MGDVALDDGRLAGQGHQLGVVGPGLHRRRVAGHVGEGGRQVGVLEGAPAPHRRGHLAREGQDRGPVHLGVVEAGEQVGGAGAGDGEAGGQLSGELAVAAGREGGRTLVADPDERQVSPFLGRPHGVGETEVGMAHHAEDVGDAPGDHGLHQHVGDGAFPGRLDGQGRIHAVVAHLGAVGGRGIVEGRRGPAVLGRVVVAVPRTAQPAALDRPLPQRSALVRAGVTEAAEAAVGGAGHAEALVADGHRHGPALTQLVGIDKLVPNELAVGKRRLAQARSWIIGRDHCGDS